MLVVDDVVLGNVLTDDIKYWWSTYATLVLHFRLSQPFNLTNVIVFSHLLMESVGLVTE